MADPGDRPEKRESPPPEAGETQKGAETPKGAEPPQGAGSERPRRAESWWPRIESVADAERVARYGFWAAAVNAALTGVLLALLLTGNPAGGMPVTQDAVWWAIADIAISLGAAVGIWFYLPAAALAGLVLFVASKAFAWTVLAGEPNVTALVIAALFAYFYLLGARGTIARARLMARGA